MGLPGWSPASAEGIGAANSGGVHADAAELAPTKKGAPKKGARSLDPTERRVRRGAP